LGKNDTDLEEVKKLIDERVAKLEKRIEELEDKVKELEE
jgi:predicted nuclease with TOPRIM domain